MNFLIKFLKGKPIKPPIGSGLNREELESRRAEAKKLLASDFKKAISIATGQEVIDDEVLAAAVYAEVCNEIEKTEDMDLHMRIANSLHNTKLSADSQTLGFRSPDAAIEKMKEVVNARREAFEKTLPKGKTTADAVAEEVERIKKFMPPQN